MTDKIPLRLQFDGSNNPIALAEYQAGDTVPVTHGGTGATTASAARENLLIVVSATEPAEPTAGLIWIDTSGV